MQNAVLTRAKRSANSYKTQGKMVQNARLNAAFNGEDSILWSPKQLKNASFTGKNDQRK